MALFQQSVLNKYLKNLDAEKVTLAYNNFQKFYGDKLRLANILKLKEENYQEGFLREIFVEALGYIINPGIKGYYDLTTEFKNLKNARKADGAILKEGKAIAVIELKSTKTKDLESIERQAFGYKDNHPGCKYVITSNFQELRFYIEYTTEHEPFDLFNLTFDDFKLLYLLLSKESVFSNLPERLKQESKFHEEKVGKKLYADYKQFKDNVFNNLIEQNPQYDKLTLFKKSQKLLDRFLFVFFAEDGGLIPPNMVSKIIDDWETLKKLNHYEPLYNTFRDYFSYLDKGKNIEGWGNIPAYNGGLFRNDEILNNPDLKIDDEILHKYSLKLSSYDFSDEVDVNILGHIFEHSLNDIEEMTAKLEGEPIDKKQSKRKKDGVFYTPKYITKYIVENTVGRLCKEKKYEYQLNEILIDDTYRLKNGKLSQKGKQLFDILNTYKDWLKTLKILDPACGSGAFLNQTLDFLIAEHKHVDDTLAELTGESIPFFITDKSILEENIYGVDINEESVEIAKLSLWLRTAQKGRPLSVLSNNIKCGNSLIDDPEVAGEKAFSWQNEFRAIFEKGGFDVVIGNPPYVDIKGLDDEVVKYIFNTYKSSNNRVNLYSTFIEKSISILKKKGRFSFIIPSSLLNLESYKELRGLILEKNTIQSIVRLPNESFGGAAGEVKVDTIIITFEKGIIENYEAEIFIYKGFDRISEIETYNTDIYFKFNAFEWKKEADNVYRINVSSEDLSIINKCELETTPLRECGDFCLGLTPYDKYKGHSQEQIKNRVFHSDYKKDDTFRKLLAGNDIKRYLVSWNGTAWISYGDWLGAPRKKRFFDSKRILVKQIIDWSDKRIWATMTEEELYNTQNAFNIIANENYTPEYIIALFNSKLISFYHRKKFLEEFKDRFQKILIKEAKEFPVKPVSLQDQKPFIDKADLILRLNKVLQTEKENFISTLKEEMHLQKITKALDNFNKLDFDAFKIEIRKQKVCFALGEQTNEWRKYFNTTKQKTNELQTQINQIDKEIDFMVYKLYELTEEEIKIIEDNV